ncbi:hypothetical protein PFICI_11866 [Pestalotiopsis fici W106-1]|uniref:Rhodopsin domain-containing protein n=1 Tax=Pestalotiopsis fici (strain W106-1 / CGMCC3.15140) TaxID=1229662 RepID=W3WRL2_PESFW|nr:uncharacterized protein PFICI_11866 [Pestalotiopsis fici W106-1]ETS76479.1 hypothetical protein PFICI_11866 [Pestalotiopsis fici W106-1]
MAASTPDYPPEYVNHDDGPRVVRVMTAVITLATIFVALRFAVRLRLRVRFALDDWVGLASLLVVWAEYVDGYLCIKYGGVGLHLPIALQRKPDALRYTFIYMFAGELLFFTGLALIKWSILAMYYRIFPTLFMKWGYAVLGSMTAAWWVAVMLTTVFQCTPVHKYWDLATPGTCINANTFYISTNGVPNIVMDAMILCLPMREVYKLHVSRKLKLAIGANFLIGSLVIIASIIKLCVMIQLYRMGSDADVTYYLADLIIWVEVEPCMGIISATLPTLRPLLTFLLHQVGLSQNLSDRASTPGRPSLITFGRGNMQKKKNGYNTTASIDNDHDSLEGLSGWPEEHHRTATAAPGDNKGGAINLTKYTPGSQQHINVRTEMAWTESNRY